MTKAEMENDYLKRITEYMLTNKRQKHCATVHELCKPLDLSAQSVTKYLKKFTAQGHLKRDRDMKTLYWLNLENG